MKRYVISGPKFQISTVFERNRSSGFSNPLIKTDNRQNSPLGRKNHNYHAILILILTPVCKFSKKRKAHYLN
jgi:hypothetical protein